MSCLSLSELSESQIDAMRTENMRRQLLKRLQLFRVDFDLSQLPTTASAHPLERGVTPDAAVAGNPLMESHA